MNRIEYITQNELKAYMLKNVIKKLDSGNEGVCYLLRDGTVLKVYGNEINNFTPLDFSKLDEINIEDIIMDPDVGIENFVFPTKIFLINRKIRAYKTRYIPNDLFKDYSYPEKIDFDKLISAYYDFLEKTFIISKKGIAYDDLATNLIFDNDKLYAIDTIHYQRKENPLQENIEALRFAITVAMNLYIYASSLSGGTSSSTSLVKFENTETIEEFITKVRQELSKVKNSNQYAKI